MKNLVGEGIPSPTRKAMYTYYIYYPRSDLKPPISDEFVGNINS